MCLRLVAVFRGDDVVIGFDVRQLRRRVAAGHIAGTADEEFPGKGVLKPHGGRGRRSRWRWIGLDIVLSGCNGCGYRTCDQTIYYGSICHIRSEEHTSELQSLRHLVCRL